MASLPRISAAFASAVLVAGAVFFGVAAHNLAEDHEDMMKNKAALIEGYESTFRQAEANPDDVNRRAKMQFQVDESLNTLEGSYSLVLSAVLACFAVGAGRKAFIPQP